VLEGKKGKTSPSAQSREKNKKKDLRKNKESGSSQIQSIVRKTQKKKTRREGRLFFFQGRNEAH